MKMGNNVFRDYYSQMTLDEILRISNSPENLNINGIPVLIKELEKRGEIQSKIKVEEFYKTTNKFKYGHLKISGWLIIILIGLMVSFAKSSFLIYELLNVYLIEDDTTLDKMINIHFYVSVGIEILMALMSLILLPMMLSFQKGFPNLMVSFYLLSVISSIYASIQNAEIGGLVITQILFASIWIYYLRKSKKVKETFIK